jgi:hypothetical protein
MKYPQYRLGALIVSYPGGPRLLADTTLVVIDIKNDGELWAEINERVYPVYPDNYSNNEVRAGVEYEIYSPL